MDPEHTLPQVQAGVSSYGTDLPSVLGPRAKRLILALTAAPLAAYGAHKAYQHFRPKEVEEQAKEATLARYGLRKEAIGDMGRNMLIGAGIGGVVTGGANYYHHHDKPDAGTRALKATGAGALVGALAGGVLTPERKWQQPTRGVPDSPQRHLLGGRQAEPPKPLIDSLEELERYFTE